MLGLCYVLVKYGVCKPESHLKGDPDIILDLIEVLETITVIRSTLAVYRFTETARSTSAG